VGHVQHMLQRAGQQVHHGRNPLQHLAMSWPPINAKVNICELQVNHWELHFGSMFLNVGLCYCSAVICCSCQAPQPGVASAFSASGCAAATGPKASGPSAATGPEASGPAAVTGPEASVAAPAAMQAEEEDHDFHDACERHSDTGEAEQVEGGDASGGVSERVAASAQDHDMQKYGLTAVVFFNMLRSRQGKGKHVRYGTVCEHDRFVLY
jgi:hypothetical protein